MMRVAMFAVFNLAVVAASLAAAPADKPQGDKLRVVLWTGGGAHDYDAIAKILNEDLPKRAEIELRVVRDGSFLDDDSRKFDVILMNHCYGRCAGVLTEPQKEKLLKSIREGTGAVASHCAFWSFNEWKEYRELFGAKFTKHGGNAPLVLSVTDGKHPVTRGLPASFEVTCELYYCTPLAKDCQLLATQRHVKGTADQFPAVWIRAYGKGRVVTVLPAHDVKSHRVGEFQKLLVNALLWSAGRQIGQPQAPAEKGQAGQPPRSDAAPK